MTENLSIEHKQSSKIETWSKVPMRTVNQSNLYHLKEFHGDINKTLSRL